MGAREAFYALRIKTPPNKKVGEAHLRQCARASGSPIFISTADGPRVVAINQGWRGYYRWRRTRSGKKQITKRWTNNYGVLLFGLADKIERLGEISFVHHSKRLGAEQFTALLRAGGLLKTRRKKPSLQSVQAAIRRFEKQQGWVPLGIPSAQFLEALRARNLALSR